MAMAMQRPLELTLVSAKDLKDVNRLTKMDLYAVVSLSVDPKIQLRTPVDHDCGKNPNWNHHMKLYVPEAEGVDPSSIFLKVLIRAEKTLGSDRDVGEVIVSVKELQAGSGPGFEPKVATYQVMTSGKAKGVLNISYKFGDPVPVPAPSAPPPVPAAGYPPQMPAAEYPPPSGYPPPDYSRSGEPIPGHPMAAGTSTAYPAPPPQAGYGYGPPPPAGYPPQGYGGHGYPPPPQPGYGYPPPPAGYAPQVQQPQQKKKNKFGLGLGAGLLGGAVGGLLIGDALGDAAAYDAGYDAGFDDAGFDDAGFDF